MIHQQSKIQVAYLFRKPSGKFHSIEEVFKNIKAGIGDRIGYVDYFLPYSNAGFLNKWKNFLYVSKLKEPLLHVTGDVYYAALLYRGDLIVTIHDMAEIFKGSFIRRWLIKMFWFQLIAWKARKIIIISEKSKKEFIDHIRVDQRKVVVIPNPLSTEIAFQPYTPNKIPEILQVGTKENKNLDRLFAALKGINCRLRIIGPLTKEQRYQLQHYGILYEQMEGIAFKEVCEAYGKVDIVTFVSTYEGFGVPIIEAQKIGRALITSNIEPMKSVAGEGAMFADPFSVDSIREAIVRLIENPELREELIRKGQHNAGRYETGTIADAYLDVYQEVLAHV